MANFRHRQGRFQRPQGMAGFLTIVFGQFFSVTGTGMSRFGLILWIWEQTNQATAVGLLSIMAFVPSLLMSPLAGALVDRYDRKWMMALSDLAAGLGSLALLLLSLGGGLALWQVYVAAAFVGLFEAFQWPAYSAATSLMIDQGQYGRATALHGLVQHSAGILAPIFAAALYGSVGLAGLLALDVASLLLALVALSLVIVPQAPASEMGSKARSLSQDMLVGFRFIWARPSLFGLQMIFFFGNMLFSVAHILIAPLVLARTGNDEGTLALVSAVMGLGGVAGGLIISAWGGFQRRIRGVVLGWTLGLGFGMVGFGLAQTPLAWALMGFMSMLSLPLVDASNQGIWMSKTPPDMQGRVFSTRRVIAQVPEPVAQLIAGPLADQVFGPAMLADGALAPIFGPLLGVGPGAGMSLMLILLGLLGVGLVLATASRPFIHHVEDIVPDHGVNLTPSPAEG